MSWLTKLRKDYLEHKKTVFILHENINDIFETDSNTDLDLSDYLSLEVFGQRDVVLNFNIGTGLKFRDEKSKDIFQKLLLGYDTLKGTTFSDKLPGDSGEIFRLLDRFIRIVGKDKSLALIISHSELLIPNEDLSQLSLEEKKILVTLQEWALGKGLSDKNISIILIAENLAELNQKIIGNSDISKISVEFPIESERKKAVKKYLNAFSIKSDLSQQAISKIINGLNRKAIRELFLTFKDSEIKYQNLSDIKKALIERENAQFFEFVESTRTLDDLAGQEKAKVRLREDAGLIKAGKSDVVPMGYLICGPVGTGKSYMAECFAGEAGIPVVKLNNFRERWVGATEANWERIVVTLKNLAPVIVMIDEADAALGNREQEGDSGTSKRVFASLASIMGDTRNRGKLIWMLLTARPELLPIDLKRQGRAEVHIPIFYPKGIEEKKEFFRILSKKIKLENIESTILPQIDLLVEDDLKEIRSGADIESVLIKIKRAISLSGKQLTKDQFIKIIRDFRSSISAEDVNRQIQNALAEVTDKDLLEGV